MPGEIDRRWPQLADALAPAIERDPARQVADVRRDLLAGDMALFAVTEPGANGFLVAEIVDRCFWVLYVAGRLDGGPKARRGRLRQLLEIFGDAARNAGCTEMRLAGRNWRPIFPDWEAPPDAFWPNELRRSLI